MEERVFIVGILFIVVNVFDESKTESLPRLVHGPTLTEILLLLCSMIQLTPRDQQAHAFKPATCGLTVSTVSPMTISWIKLFCGNYKTGS